jgi:hypothetical protein
MFIMGFVAAATCEIFAALNLVSFKSNSQFNAILSARRLISIIGPQIRSAHRITVDRQNQLLAIEIPILGDASKGGLDEVPQLNTDNPSKIATDLFEYKVIGDTQHPNTGQFVIQRTYRPGPRTAYCIPIASFPPNQGQTIATGITGPINTSLSIDPTAGSPLPQIFTALVKSPFNSADLPEHDSNLSATTDGVAITCELKDPLASASIQLKAKSIGVRSEFYKRSSPIGQY